MPQAGEVRYRIRPFLRHTWRSLRSDRVFWLLAPLLAAVVVLTAVPILTETQAEAWGLTFSNLTLYGMAMASVMVGVGAIPSERERLFWRWTCFPMAVLFALYCVWGIGWIWFPDLLESRVLELASQGTYLAFYVGFSLAIDSLMITGQERSARMLRWMRSGGLGVLLAGILMYVAVVPVVHYSEYHDSWPPILLTYAALDLLICLRFLHARSGLADSRWRGILAWMALAFAAWAVVDFAEAALYLGLLGEFETLPVWELQWYAPIVIFVIAARIHIGHPRSTAEPTMAQRSALIGAGPLVVYTVAIPLVHLVLYNSGIPAPELRPMREAVALAVLVVVGVIALAYQLLIEHENKSAHARLKASQEKYQSFVTTSVEGVWLVEFRPPIDSELAADEQARAIYLRAHVVEANDAMARMHEEPDAEQIIGRSLRSIKGLEPRNRANANATRKFVRSGYRILNELTEYRDREGNTRQYEGSVSGIVEHGFLVRAWGTQVDVTARIAAQAEKEKLEQQLRQSQKMETIGTLAGGVAHDFNNLLTPILGFSELALGSVAGDDATTREYLRNVSKSAERAKRLVNQILTVSRPRKGVREPIELAGVVAEAVELLRQSVPTRIEITVVFDPRCPPVLADSGQMHQLVMNLCTNSSQAIGPGTGVIKLVLRELDVNESTPEVDLAPGRYAVLTVADDGEGMPPEAAERAFEPFFTTRDVGRGTGLGLSVVHGIATSHGGSVKLESHVGEGTTVTVFLPATEEVPQGAGGETGPAPARADGERVLLVDDEPTVLKLGVAMLGRAGYIFTAVGDPREALRLLELEPDGFDLLLTDYSMPGMTGLQLAERALALNERTAVVVASGYRLGQMSEDAGKFLRLSKPYTRAELLQAVSEALESRRARQP